MKKDLTLVILAAGMGSRFGGLKQLEPIGPNGEFIIDYSVYDAIKTGFTKIVFIIKKENYEIFKETIGSRIEGKIKVEYAFQELDNIPKGVEIPLDRKKPWGTAHALYSAIDYIDSDFVLINADDFYGRSAYLKIKDFFLQEKDPNIYAMVAFNVASTMTSFGSVKRGICESQDNYLTNIIESVVEHDNGKIKVSPLDGRESFYVPENQLVSMTFFGFRPAILDFLKKDINNFFETNKDNLEKCEYLMPDVVFKEIKENSKKVFVLESSDKWLGVTYKEDKEYVQEELQKLIKKGEYPYDLWK